MSTWEVIGTIVLTIFFVIIGIEWLFIPFKLDEILIELKKMNKHEKIN